MYIWMIWVYAFAASSTKQTTTPFDNYYLNLHMNLPQQLLPTVWKPILTGSRQVNRSVLSCDLDLWELNRCLFSNPTPKARSHWVQRPTNPQICHSLSNTGLRVEEGTEVSVTAFQTQTEDLGIQTSDLSPLHEMKKSFPKEKGEEYVMHTSTLRKYTILTKYITDIAIL